MFIMILKIVMLFCNYLEYKKFLLIIDKKKYDDTIDFRNKTKLIHFLLHLWRFISSK